MSQMWHGMQRKVVEKSGPSVSSSLVRANGRPIQRAKQSLLTEVHKRSGCVQLAKAAFRIRQL